MNWGIQTAPKGCILSPWPRSLKPCPHHWRTFHLEVTLKIVFIFWVPRVPQSKHGQPKHLLEVSCLKWKKKICELYLIHLFSQIFVLNLWESWKKKYSQHLFSFRFIVNNLPHPFNFSFLHRYVWKDIHEEKKNLGISFPSTLHPNQLRVSCKYGDSSSPST